MRSDSLPAYFQSPVDAPPSDLELFRALQTRQPLVLGQLYDLYGDIMYSLALRILGNPQEAEDLVQEIFLSLWRACTFNPDRGSFKTFLLVLVRSRAIDRLRSQKKTRTMLERSGKEITDKQFSSAPLDEVAADEVGQRVRLALANLPENQRQALEMSYFEGLTQREISDRLEVSLGTVKSWFRLGFTKLRQSLEDLIN
ncbi:sigma-70 family RNA polymerase sigma factor [Pseudanabaena sp. PCC 6802]|uniref:sigma-70 family RNA polymerase sigma factor n=1 Tax=Pseudanabaena sp. PCC 6802 TaxID=118173 RepID=UPI00035C6ECA|nr:sigma-70 family RNA polymerase sigma factor [Pseudanabaena sp. PCC 6802]